MDKKLSLELEILKMLRALGKSIADGIEEITEFIEHEAEGDQLFALNVKYGRLLANSDTYEKICGIGKCLKLATRINNVPCLSNWSPVEEYEGLVSKMKVLAKLVNETANTRTMENNETNSTLH